MIGKHSSSFPHITTCALLLLANLWQKIFKIFMVFYFIIELMVSQLLCFFMTCVLVHLFTLYLLWMGSLPCLFRIHIFLYLFIYLLNLYMSTKPLSFLGWTFISWLNIYVFLIKLLFLVRFHFLIKPLHLGKTFIFFSKTFLFLS